MEKKKWSEKYDKCVVCGTTKVKYSGNGMCHNCYNRDWNKKNLKKSRASAIKYRNRHLEECKKRQKKYHRENPEKARQYKIEYKKKYPEKIKERSKKYRENNPEKIKESNKEWREKNKEKIRESHNEYQKNKRKTDLHFRLRDNVSSIINKRLKKRLISKEGKLTFDFISYTIDELIEHLEKQFEPWMSWDNYGKGKGKWQIDHIKPDSLFKYISIGDKKFQECWALSNLQPLDAVENGKKSDKY